MPHLESAGSSSTWRYATYSGRPAQGRWAGWRRAVQARHDSDRDRWYISQALPLYGLPPGWQGERDTGGAGVSWPGHGWRSSLPGRRGRVDRLALVHRAADGACLTVSSHRAAASARFIDAAALDGLFGGPGPLPPSGRAGSQPPVPASRPSSGELAWQEISIPVDGRPITFRILANGNDWVAVASLGGIYLKLHASRFPPADVVLVRVPDPRPYLPPGPPSLLQAQT